MAVKTMLFLLGLACLSLATRAAEATELYHGQGVVTGILNKGQVLVIKHQAIPGLMDAMTMPFELSDVGLGKGIKVGDQIRFTLKKRGDFWPIIALKKIKRPKHAAGVEPAKAAAQPTATMAPMNMPM